MKQYLQLLNTLLETGERRTDRTGTGTLSLFGYQMRFDLSAGFPLVTTKKCHLRSIIHEILWFLKGDTNIKYLRDNNVTIWDEWADANGDLGPIYGEQWTRWKTRDGREINQIAEAVELIKTNPDSRRILISGWNVDALQTLIKGKKSAPPPCHSLFQFYVHTDKRLSCQLYQRSADSFLGVPFNIASYALLTLMMAQVTGLKPGYFIHTFGDVHLYLNHIEQAKLQLTREPRTLPRMNINPVVKNIFGFKFEDFVLEGYEPWPAIKAEISI